MIPQESSQETNPHCLDPSSQNVQSSSVKQCDKLPTVAVGIDKQQSLSQDTRPNGLLDSPVGLEPPEVRMDDSTRPRAGTQTNEVPGAESRGETDVVRDNSCIGFEAAEDKETRWQGIKQVEKSTAIPHKDTVTEDG